MIIWRWEFSHVMYTYLGSTTVVVFAYCSLLYGIIQQWDMWKRFSFYYIYLFLISDGKLRTTNNRNSAWNASRPLMLIYLVWMAFLLLKLKHQPLIRLTPEDDTLEKRLKTSEMFYGRNLHRNILMLIRFAWWCSNYSVCINLLDSFWIYKKELPFCFLP